jgi:hypothetical protein
MNEMQCLVAGVSHREGVGVASERDYQDAHCTTE